MYQMFGSHLSVAGGLHNALLDARALDMECVQVFTKNQRQWKAKPLNDEQIALWDQHRRQTALDEVVSHSSYLINLASPDAQARGKSVTLFKDELRRCQSLGIPNLVIHPGAHMGAGEQRGLERVVRSLDRVHESLPDLSVVTCLEVTAGQGTSLGWRFEHLRHIIDRVQQPGRLAVCLDSAHMLAAGYDLTSARGCGRVLDEVSQVIGMDLVRVIHLNDSKVPRGRRVDRHEHIGHGEVSLQAFRTLVNDHRFKRVPKILETAKEDAPDGRSWDAVNLEMLRRLIAKRKKSRTRRDQVEK